ncbi:hypothetical protein ACVJGD_008060 [Bradyrhizobium sp. USDA 10063]
MRPLSATGHSMFVFGDVQTYEKVVIIFHGSSSWREDGLLEQPSFNTASVGRTTSPPVSRKDIRSYDQFGRSSNSVPSRPRATSQVAPHRSGYGLGQMVVRTSEGLASVPDNLVITQGAAHAVVLRLEGTPRCGGGNRSSPGAAQILSRERAGHRLRRDGEVSRRLHGAANVESSRFRRSPHPAMTGDAFRPERREYRFSRLNEKEFGLDSPARNSLRLLIVNRWCLRGGILMTCADFLGVMKACASRTSCHTTCC